VLTNRWLRGTVATLCPVLLATFPLLSLFTQNQMEVELRVLWGPLLVTTAATLALYGALFLVTRRAASASMAASTIVVAFFYYGVWLGGRPGWMVWPWLAALVAVAVLAVRTSRDLAPVLVIVAVMAAVWAVPRAISVARYQFRHPSLAATDARLWPAALTAPVAPPSRPDIYVIVPDDYARADVLAQYFHYDDSPFLHALEQRGFQVSETTRSPYADSESNTASLLNMDYLTNFPKVLGAESQDVRPVKRVIEDNRAARLLREVGYRYVHIDTDEVTFAGGNPDISPFAPPDSFGNLWMEKSVLARLGGPLGFNDRARNARFRHAIKSQFARLGDLAKQDGPKFVVFHTLLPHDPYIYGAHGESVTYTGASDEALSSDAGRLFYRHQLEYLHSLLLGSVDRIRAASKTPPVILIRSDEGFQTAPDLYGQAAMNQIRVKGLAALSSPGRSGLPDPPNAANDLRFIFNQYLGTRYPMLPTHSYPDGDFPYEYKEMQVN
jgi:hypothetical protein